MIFEESNISPGEWGTQFFMGFWDTNGSPNLGQTTRHYNNQQQKKNKKKINKIVDFALPADQRVKLKESEKKDKYLDLARELKKLRNMKVTFLLIVMSASRNYQRHWKT